MQYLSIEMSKNEERYVLHKIIQGSTMKFEKPDEQFVGIVSGAFLLWGVSFVFIWVAPAVFSLARTRLLLQIESKFLKRISLRGSAGK